MHPFADEIASLLEHPPLTTFMTNHEYSDMSNSYVRIDTEHQLDLLARLLSKERVFAVDTEQHSLRSFLGFTALMQVNMVAFVIEYGLIIVISFSIILYDWS